MTSLPNIREMLSAAERSGASDLHLKAGIPPVLRIDGSLQPSRLRALREEDVETYLAEMIPEHLKVEFKETNEADFSFGGSNGGGRFRVNAFRQRSVVSVAVRILTEPDKTFAELALPPVLERLVDEPRGLILVTGPTGSGKTTTLAALIDAINTRRKANIITVEDPIEVVHRDKLSMIHQREVGADTVNFSEALRRVLRQDPDVILIGEMRDVATIDAALKAAETGHLVFSTLHTLDTTETINRILDFFPAGLQRQIRLLLAGSLKGILSQRLIPRADGRGRIPAVEVLINTDRVAERIADADLTHEIPDVVAEGAYYGMETFDQCILRLLSAEKVTFEEAMRHASKPADFKLSAQQKGLIST